MSALRVTILHQAVPPDAPPDELDVLDEVRAVRAALRRLGHKTAVVPMTGALDETRRALRRSRPDCVFNLVESVLGCGPLAVAATALLDSEGMAYTGAATAAMALTTDKLATKRALERSKIATPAWVTSRESQAFRAGVYLIKPIAEDASVGLDADSLVRVRSLAACRLELLRRGRMMSRPLFAERYIDGREFNVSLIGWTDEPCVLPIAEICFTGFEEQNKPKLVGYRAKWEPGSFEYQNTKRRFVDPASERALYRRLERMARRAWNTLGCRGYARVDLRVDKRGCPWLLEVNANPCIAPDAGFVAAANQAKLTFTGLIAEILRLTLEQ